MKVRVKVLSFLLCMILLLGLLPVQASAATVVKTGYCGGEGNGTNLRWSLDSMGVLSISGKGKMRDYNTSSSSPWDSYKNSIKKVVIDDGVSSIGNYAFYKCSSLTRVTIPDSVTSIGSRAFYDCSSLTSVTIPDSVTSIGVRAFANTPWLKAHGDFGVVNGLLFAYQGAGADVTIPDSVTSIGDFVFENCRSLTSG